MKLIQLNCWTGRLGPSLYKFLKKEQPDILCLQEVTGMPVGDEIVFLTIDKIEQAMDAKSTYMSPVFSFNFMRRRAEFGNAIVSKFPIIKKETVFTHGEFTENLDHSEDGSNMRNLQHAVIELTKGRKLNVLNHHGYHIEHHKNGDKETLRQCKMIADFASKLNNEQVILTGDFNLSPDSDSIKQIDKVLINLAKKNKINTTRNILSNKTEVCDYIFVNNKINVRGFNVSEAMVSDHKALILNFEIKNI